jgi:hypothetical protein
MPPFAEGLDAFSRCKTAEVHYRGVIKTIYYIASLLQSKRTKPDKMSLYGAGEHRSIQLRLLCLIK